MRIFKFSFCFDPNVESTADKTNSQMEDQCEATFAIFQCYYKNHKNYYFI